MFDWLWRGCLDLTRLGNRAYQKRGNRAYRIWLDLTRLGNRAYRFSACGVHEHRCG